MARSEEPTGYVDTLVNRARRLRRKGEKRKALQALREACLIEEQSAWLWTLYGWLLAEAHREGEARQAYRHAVWLRRHGGDERRARSTQRLLDELGPSSAAA